MSTNKVTLSTPGELLLYHPTLREYLKSIEDALNTGNTAAARQALVQLNLELKNAVGRGHPVPSNQDEIENALIKVTNELNGTASDGSPEVLLEGQDAALVAGVAPQQAQSSSDGQDGDTATKAPAGADVSQDASVDVRV